METTKRTWSATFRDPDEPQLPAPPPIYVSAEEWERQASEVCGMTVKWPCGLKLTEEIDGWKVPILVHPVPEDPF